MRYLMLLVLVALTGCADSTTALVETARYAFSRPKPVIDTAKLDPRYRFLRVAHPGGVSGMILGAIDSTPGGQVEIWYASDGEIIRLENGRLAGITGLQPEWRSVTLPNFPAWSKIAAQSEPFHWERVRDVMPGYRYGVRDRLVLVVVPAPASTGIIGLDPKQFVWFEERMEASTEDILPPARYAVEGDRVVYGEQCVAPESCFRWQRWPAGA